MGLRAAVTEAAEPRAEPAEALQARPLALHSQVSVAKFLWF